MPKLRLTGGWLRAGTAAAALAACLLVPAVGAAQPAPQRYAAAWSHDTHGAEALFRPTAIVVTPECQVWLADAGNARLYRWDCAGRVLPAIGRKGEGPGEFNTPAVAALLRGNTVGVWDRPLQRLSLFAPDGRYLGARRLSIGGASHGFVRGFALNYPETLVSAEVHPGEQPRPIDGHTIIWAADGEGRVTRPLVRVPGPRAIVDRGGKATVTLRPPFAAYPAVLFSPRGFVLVATSPNGEFTRYRYGSRLAEDGRLRLNLSGPPVTRADRNRWRDSMQTVLAGDIERGGGADPAVQRSVQERFRRLLGDVRFPRTHPAYERAVLDSDDRLWLQLTAGPANVTRWHVYHSRTGALLKVVDLPTRERIVAARPFRDMLFVVHHDGEGVPRLVRYAPAG